VDAQTPSRKVFSYDEAAALMPEVRRITEEACQQVAALGATLTADGLQPESARDAVDVIVRAWAETLVDLGLEIKGLWLVDFDNGAGYYCWRHPEPSLQYYHSYEDGFSGRIRIQ